MPTMDSSQCVSCSIIVGLTKFHGRQFKKEIKRDSNRLWRRRVRTRNRPAQIPLKNG